MIEIQPHEIHAIAPFIIPAALAAGQMIWGGIQGGKAKRKSAEADRLHRQIPQQDPGMAGFLNDLRMKQRYAETGQSRIANLDRQEIRDANEQTQTNLLRGAGTSPGALQQGLLRSNNQTQRALAQVGARSEAAAGQYMQMQAPLISDIADRTLSLQTYLRDRTAFEGAAQQQQANNAIAGGLGLASSFDVNKWAKGGSAKQGVSAETPPVAVGQTFVNDYTGTQVQGLGNPGMAPHSQPNSYWATDWING